MKNESRTGVDFSKHIVLESHFKNETHNIDIWDLKLPEYNHQQRILFINSCGTLMVNGDYGNWVFCREFHPSKDGYVSDCYWSEKLKIASVQDSAKYDSERTAEEIKVLIKSGLKEYGYEGEELKKKKNQFKELLQYVDDELDYTYHAYRELSIDDYEMIPFAKTRHIWLSIIYDAFDYICSIQKE